jgi:hypothetical protein
VLDLIANGREVRLMEDVLGAVQGLLADELADSRAPLHQTLAAEGATLARVLAVVQREFLAG